MSLVRVVLDYIVSVHICIVLNFVVFGPRSPRIHWLCICIVLNIVVFGPRSPGLHFLCICIVLNFVDFGLALSWTTLSLVMCGPGLCCFLFSMILDFKYLYWHRGTHRHNLRGLEWTISTVGWKSQETQGSIPDLQRDSVLRGFLERLDDFSPSMELQNIPC